ncbi:hypothetical protein ACFL5O_02530 [Myxococcota bacterium]
MTAAGSHGLRIATCLAALGCQANQQNVESAEATRIASAVRTLREAQNEDKSVLLGTLEQTTCTQPALCTLKARCVEGYRRHLSGLDALRAVRDELAQDAGELQRRGKTPAAQLLREAERELKAAHAATTQCAALEHAIRERYAL